MKRCIRRSFRKKKHSSSGIFIRDIHIFYKIPNSLYFDYHFCWQIQPCCMFNDRIASFENDCILKYSPEIALIRSACFDVNRLFFRGIPPSTEQLLQLLPIIQLKTHYKCLNFSLTLTLLTILLLALLTTFFRSNLSEWLLHAEILWFIFVKIMSFWLWNIRF